MKYEHSMSQESHVYVQTDSQPASQPTVQILINCRLELLILV